MLPTTEDTASLVARAQGGDRWASEALFRAHAPAVARVARLLLGQSADVDDVLQDTFVKALGKLSELREPAAFGGWACRIAANLARSRLRKRRLLSRFGLDRGEQDVALDELAVHGCDPETKAELARIGKLLGRLDPDARTLWTLRRIEGWELTEVAEATGLSLATVKRRLSATDDILKTRLVSGGET